MNPTLAPRQPNCTVCRTVADLSDIAIRLWEDGDHRIEAGTWRVADYLAEIGHSGAIRALEGRAQTHRAHVEKWMKRGIAAVAPVLLQQDGVTRIPRPERGPARWVDVQQRGMDVGDLALDKITDAILSDTMDDKDLIAVAKLGQAAASKRADLEMKGQIKRAEAMARLASGFEQPAEITVKA